MGRPLPLSKSKGSPYERILELVRLETALCVDGLRIEHFDDLTSVKYLPLLQVKGEGGNESTTVSVSKLTETQFTNPK
jgi:hypothetical protein